MLLRLVLALAAASIGATAQEESINVVEEHRQLQGAPAYVAGLGDVSSPIGATDVPVLWNIPRTGYVTIEYIFAYCLGLAQANAYGTDTKNVTIGVHEKTNANPKYPFKPRYTNFRVHTKKWIDDAKERNAIAAGVTEVLVTPYLSYATEELFVGSGFKARPFIMMRHPGKRILDEFFYHQHATVSF